LIPREGREGETSGGEKASCASTSKCDVCHLRLRTVIYNFNHVTKLSCDSFRRGICNLFIQTRVEVNNNNKNGVPKRHSCILRSIIINPKWLIRCRRLKCILLTVFKRFLFASVDSSLYETANQDNSQNIHLYDLMIPSDMARYEDVTRYETPNQGAVTQSGFYNNSNEPYPIQQSEAAYLPDDTRVEGRYCIFIQGLCCNIITSR